MIKVPIDMPETCLDCPLRYIDEYADDYFCEAKKDKNGLTRCFTSQEKEIAFDGRQEWCPLIQCER